jgi:hypothetical protein
LGADRRQPRGAPPGRREPGPPIAGRSQSTQQISSAIQALENDAAAVATAIGQMTAGISGLDEVTAVLGNVASEQRALVSRLDAAVSEAIERVCSTSNLTQRLERRRAERMAASGHATIDVNGQQYQAELRDIRLRDISVLGAQLATPATSLRAGDRLQLELPLGSSRLRLPGCLVRVVPEIRVVPESGGGCVIGVEYHDVDPAGEARLRTRVEALMQESSQP